MYFLYKYWSGHIGNKFSISNGVKQGGVLSPILFLVYLDGLLTKLNKKSVGCHMGNYFVGVCLLRMILPLLHHQERLYKL